MGTFLLIRSEEKPSAGKLRVIFKVSLWLGTKPGLLDAFFAPGMEVQ